MDRARPALLLAAYVFVSLATRAVLLRVPIIDVDESSYAVASWAILRGAALYHDVADHKPPLVYLYYALAQELLGRGMLSVRILTTLVVLPLTALGLSAFYRHSRAGALAGLAYLLYGSAFIGHDMLAVNCEVLLLLPATWALVLVGTPPLSRRAAGLAGAGALLGVATLFKHQAGLWLPVPLVAAWTAGASEGRAVSLRRAALVLAGFALPLAACAGYFAWRGTFSDFVYWNLTHNLRYAANPIRAEEAERRAAVNLLPFLVVTGPLWWIAWRARHALPSAHAARVVWGALALAVLSAAIGFRFYPHYFVLIEAPLALAAAPGAVALLDPPRRPAGRLLIGWTAAMTVAWAVANLAIYARADIEEETRPAFRDVAALLSADRCRPGASLFVWGYAPMLYYTADLPMATRFLFLESTLVGYIPGNAGSLRGSVDTARYIRPEHWDWLMDDLARRPPTYVVDTSTARIHHWQRYPLSSYPRLWSLVSRDYERLGSVDEVQVYRRKGCACEGR